MIKAAASSNGFHGRLPVCASRGRASIAPTKNQRQSAIQSVAQ
jgi:hypothetical protein